MKTTINVEGGYAVEHGVDDFAGGVRITVDHSHLGIFVPKQAVMQLSRTLADIMAKQADADAAAAARKPRVARVREALSRADWFDWLDTKPNAHSVAEHYRAHIKPAEATKPKPKPDVAQAGDPRPLNKLSAGKTYASYFRPGFVALDDLAGLNIFYVTPDTAETIAHTIAYFQDPQFSVTEAVTGKVYAMRIASDLEVTRALLRAAKEARRIAAPEKIRIAGYPWFGN